MYTQTHVRTYTQTHTDTDTCTHTHTCTDTHRHMYMHTHTPVNSYKRLQYFRCSLTEPVLHSRGRQRAQHTLLPLLSLRSAIEQSVGSQCQ
ncbi:unnamed protein product [Staurois parvus]|uniref:Uncharacterized protein n=1 Tax=Staurois parvus TaxID=386267 RepID=A0ABN9BGA4_9NEOB|nr:unnamed protein product [Staurois parvus]